MPLSRPSVIFFQRLQARKPPRVRPAWARREIYVPQAASSGPLRMASVDSGLFDREPNRPLKRGRASGLPPAVFRYRGRKGGLGPCSDQSTAAKPLYPVAPCHSRNACPLTPSSCGRLRIWRSPGRGRYRATCAVEFGQDGGADRFSSSLVLERSSTPTHRTGQPATARGPRKRGDFRRANPVLG